MALAAVPKAPAEIEADAKAALKAEALQRLADARLEKSDVETDHKNAYFYAAPRRLREQNSQSTSSSKPHDDRELQTSFGIEVTDEFASMEVETFMPREGWWAERRLPTNPDEEGNEDPDIVEMNKLIRAEDKKIFDLIRASNFYAETAKQAKPDAAIGVNAVTVRDPGGGRPLVCLGVSIRELDMALGPDGRIDFRSITRRRKRREMRAVLGKAIADKLPDQMKRDAKDKPDEVVEVVWAWWRDWENEGDIRWQHVVLVAGEMVHDATMTGEGSCPLVIGRFGATPDFAWPDGPLVNALADLMTLDSIRAALIENVDFTLRPPKAYEDDGVLNIPVDGVRPGDLYPKRPSGGKQAFEDIYQPRPIEAALFDVDHMESRIRRLHYVDFPEQRGKTPPTATQWVDELVIRQRRIGTPGYAFWREYPYEVFQRFRYLGERRGAVKTMAALGVPSGEALQPYNPAERAQDSQDIQTAVQFAQIGQAFAPTMWQVMLDEAKTLENLKAKFRDEVIVFRSETEAEGRIKLLAQLGMQVAQQGGAGGAKP